MAVACLVVLFWPPAAVAQPLPCSGEFLIDHTFTSGSRWEMCFEERDREGIVLSEAHYTPPVGARRRVFGELAVAQIHVPYDDNGARFHDVSDFGIGDFHLSTLGPSECPDGVLHSNGERDVVCRQVRSRGPAWVREIAGPPALDLVVWSASGIGAYNYIPEWRFGDDGAIEIRMGATGRLQRKSTNAENLDYGWPLDNAGTIGISHLHNFYWRLDFDLGTEHDDDAFEQLDWAVQDSAGRRARSIERFTQEVALDVDPDLLRSWRVVDTATNADVRAQSYEIETVLSGHRDTGPSNEPFTFHDVYVTVNKACERFASHNPASEPECPSFSDLSDFVDGQSLVDQDLVVWVGLTFHHIPRDEDEPRMWAHWNSFRILPLDALDSNPLDDGTTTNRPPEVVDPADQGAAEGDSVTLQIEASDPDLDDLACSATGLPPDLEIDDETGEISGQLSYESAGDWTVEVTVGDGEHDVVVDFQWQVANTNRTPILSPIDSRTEPEGVTISLPIDATDPDGDELFYSATGLPPGLEVQPGGNRIVGTLTYHSAGEWPVQVVVTDSQRSAAAQFTWFVTDVAAPPALSAWDFETGDFPPGVTVVD